MRNTRPGYRRAAAALLAAAALPFAPLAAQEAQPATEPPAQEVQQPPAEAPQPKAATPPAEPAPTPAAEVEAEAAPAPAARTAPARRAPARAAARPAPRAAVRAPAIAAAPAPAADVAAPVAETVPPAEAAVPPGTVEELPAETAAGTDVVPAAAAPAQAQEGGSMLPWALGALAIAAFAIFLLLRRGRRRDEEVYDEVYYEEPVHHQPVEAVEEPVASDPQPIHHQPAAQPAPERAVERPLVPNATISTAAPAAFSSSALTAPVIGGIAASGRPAAAPQVQSRPPQAEPVIASAAAAPAAVPEGRPEIDLRMRPVRAGVDGEGARVEFELTVDNTGSGPAEEVRVSTWMLATGATDAEQALIAPASQADTPSVTIAAGEARTLEASVGLPTSEVTGDSVLPVVVAEVTHRLADGSTAHATARFAVGVPDGEELAHFSTDNPSGLHEGVVARELGEIERA